MPITLYSGKTGSGKTYRAVAEMWKKKDNVFILHNITGLKKGAFPYEKNFSEYCEENNITPDRFFTKEVQGPLCEAIRDKYGKNVLLVIDECYEWFTKRNDDILVWLAYHRHYGQEVWLIAAREMQIHSDYRGLIDAEWRGKHGMIFSVPGIFVYQRLAAGGESLGMSIIRKNKEIFDLYKSADLPEAIVKRSPMIPAIMIFSSISIACLVYYFSDPLAFGREDREKAGKAGRIAQGIDDKKKDIELQSEIRKLNKEMNSSSGENKEYFFRGQAGDHYLIEDQEGRNFYLSQVMPRVKVIKHERLQYLKLYDVEKNKIIVFRNTPRIEKTKEDFKMDHPVLMSN